MNCVKVVVAKRRSRCHLPFSDSCSGHPYRRRLSPGSEPFGQQSRPFGPELPVAGALRNERGKNGGFRTNRLPVILKATTDTFGSDSALPLEMSSPSAGNVLRRSSRGWTDRMSVARKRSCGVLSIESMNVGFSGDTQNIGDLVRWDYLIERIPTSASSAWRKFSRNRTFPQRWLNSGSHPQQ